MRIQHMTMMVALAWPLATFAAPQTKDPNGANPTDIATSKAADGAIIDKTHAAPGASAAATNDMRSMQGAKAAATSGSASGGGRKQRPAPVSKGSSTAM